MTNAKDKRIKKLKKKRIWPSVFGLLFMLFLFTVIVIAVIASVGLDVFDRKMSDGSNQSAMVAKIYEGYTEESASHINEMVMTYIGLSPEIEAVGLIDSEGKKVWSSHNAYPDTERVTTFELQTFGTNLPMKIVVEEDLEEVFTLEDNEVTVNDDLIEALGLLRVFRDNSIVLGRENSNLVSFKIWFVVPVNQLNVYVLNNISINVQDLFMLLVSVGIFILIILIFTIYYIISFFSVIASMRKTTKIIYTDMVTGGDNWLHFVKKGASLLKRSKRNAKRYAVLHMRMRKYRSFCTCFGVQEGEALIEKLYCTAKKKLKRNELIAYHENAEFGILLTYTDRAQLSSRIEMLEKELSTVLPNMKLYFGIGVCEVKPGERDVETLYNNALIACDLLGEEAELQIAFFDEEMNKQKMWERKVEDEMERALTNKEFKVYLQPKISAKQEILAGAEALVRWIHPVDGFIPPNRFIPIFEQNGFILKLDDYMLEEVARIQAQWISEGRRIVPISVNVSRAHFTREDLAEHICKIVDKYKVPHDVIELELTESAFFDDKKVLLGTVQKLRNFGFIVSMDDFGAGYSSLNSLKELQIDVLKIDADFFRGENVEERGMLIVSEVIDLAKKLNMKIVAEGIESREQVDFLIEQECDLIQGYFFAKPMAIEEFVEKYKN
ncbi:MAG: EAL domain-containing protein [Lachnospiraceae bacterium]|nr:EAL domain-containing protein [Lachnospiraceae bacterium]